MPIAFRCQQCGEAFKGPDTLAGKKIKCRKCSAIVTIPSPPQAKPAPRPATPAPPAVDLLQTPINLQSHSVTSPLMMGSSPYTLPSQAGPKAKKPKAPARQSGPGAVQSVVMIGGTVLAVALFAGAYGVFHRMTAHMNPVATPKTGMEAVKGFQQTKVGPSEPDFDPDDE